LLLDCKKDDEKVLIIVASKGIAIYMNIIIVTQNDVFYLGRYLDYLIKRLPYGAKISGIIIFDFLPFGKADSLVKRIGRTYQVFGLFFLLDTY
jgi:methionyl-tRNA formyltransferase